MHWDNTNHKLVATATKSDEVLTVGNFDTTSSNNPAGIVGYTEGVGNDSIDLSGPLGVGGAANTGIGVIGVSSTGYGGLFRQTGASPGFDSAFRGACPSGNYKLAEFKNNSTGGTQDRARRCSWRRETAHLWIGTLRSVVQIGFGLTLGQFYLEDLGKGVRLLIDGSGNVVLAPPLLRVRFISWAVMLRYVSIEIGTAAA